MKTNNIQHLMFISFFAEGGILTSQLPEVSFAGLQYGKKWPPRGAPQTSLIVSLTNPESRSKSK